MYRSSTSVSGQLTLHHSNLLQRTIDFEVKESFFSTHFCGHGVEADVKIENFALPGWTARWQVEQFSIWLLGVARLSQTAHGTSGSGEGDLVGSRD